MKKKLIILSFALVPLQLLSLNLNEVISIHKNEQEQATQGLHELLDALFTIETNIWISNIRKASSIRDATYPTSTLTQDEVSILLTSIQSFQENTRSQIQSSDKTLQSLFNIITRNALNINKPSAASGFTKSKYGYWKPITQSYFKRVKAIIKSFAPQAQLQASTPPGDRGHYFTSPNTGATLRKL